ncbi:2-oxoglutarate dehydrogenase E1 component [sulfur-oxidizing endosymbiont of Gigantopelta aegis]|uniref:2-oxoglutarate dehydrogenase E1 component n=1 Tax=sulfur-oxidizing endosymbiont of Gigantopelta aegis TaxID=2794934 RepID=UPI0018DD6A37|nr:2-oxoglutarate dehydrogenase E1 component [sulfur-oxidizing endosymbiont of Gigantopelta aegis]
MSDSDNMQNKQASSWLDGDNAVWLEYMYEAYINNPEAIDQQWRNHFDTLSLQANKTGNTVKETAHSTIREQFRKQASRATISGNTITNNSCPDISSERKQVKVLQLINAYRILGHYKANLNPLYATNETNIPELTLSYHQLSEADLSREFDTGSLNTDERASLAKILLIVQQSYCHTIGSEYMHISDTNEKRWLQQKLESVTNLPDLHFKARQRILRRLTAAEGLEKYLHTRYVGQKRFSLEGAESLIPLLDELVQKSASYNIKETVIGMAHRGRLNVLINILGKTASELFDEFEGKKDTGDYMGDVKYHMGFSSDITTTHSAMHLTLAFNPSHLEIVAPVVEGSVRARQDRRFDKTGDQIIPIQIHGDAAFSGQGVVMETFQMSQARGYSTKGTIHIVINNQIGFTTSNVMDVRSTQYCTEVSKMVNAPIFHVNGDDPEAVVFVAQMALDYRMKFKKDVVIDMICYRRHGHNEADEPSATQPMMYKLIKALPTTREIYVKKMQQAQIFTAEEAEQLKEEYRNKVEAGLCVAPNISSQSDDSIIFHWSKYTGNALGQAVKSSITVETIKLLMDQLEVLPKGFERHPRVEKIIVDRHKMTAGALPLDWGYAETLAYASLVNDGYNVRLSGQDSGRGTFFHRHVVWHNQLKKQAWVPLKHLKDGQLKDDDQAQIGDFLVIDSLLSEEAVLAFEYGYN